MEAHIIEIVRFLVCLASPLTAMTVMIKVGDNYMARRLAAGLAAVVILFNQQIGILVYLLLGSILETLITAMGVAFIIILAIVIVFFPLIAVIRWIIH